MKNKPAQFYTREGDRVGYAGEEYVITHVLSLDQVVAKNLASGELQTLKIAELHPPPELKDPDKPASEVDLLDVSTEDWEKAKDRLRLIKPLLAPRVQGDALAKKIAQDSGIGIATIYRWRSQYLSSGVLSSLLPSKPGIAPGKSRLKDKNVEHIIEEAISNYYMTDAKPSIVALMRRIRILCGDKIKPPHLNTVRKRIQWKAGRAMVAARHGEQVASMRFDAIEGTIPDAEWPLAMVQLDHTEMPVTIVDDIYRRPIGRPWVTLSIDVNSRVAPGMYLSLDHPSAMSAGMCVSHAILPKEAWLAEIGAQAEWPCWGVMGSLHMDNAPEFRGNMMRAASEEYGIDLHLRPVKKPHYGGHIERLMGTLSEELKQVPGATFANPDQKGEYDAEGNAIMTMAELERYVVYLLAHYHHREHKSLNGMSPLQKYQQGLLGGKGKPGRGLPARRTDEDKLRIDFMPFVERTIQDYGVVIDDVYYFDDVLRPWINATDPDNSRITRKFRFRFDPRDISVLYFFEPNVKRYYPIHYRDLSKPAISVWEREEARRALKKDNIKPDEQLIFDYIRKMHEEIQQAEGKTKAARKQQQKKAEHDKARQRKKSQAPEPAKSSSLPSTIPGYDPGLVTPYEDD